MPYLNKGQEIILDSLLESSKSINDLVLATDLSDSYVRNTVKYLEASGQVEKVDMRTPYIYRIPLDDPRVKLKELVQLYETKLIARDMGNSIVKFLIELKLPKDRWPEMADDFEAAAIAIRNLNKQRKLVPTLED
jgi:DNA-binding transcriptional ArsR family regulator